MPGSSIVPTFRCRDATAAIEFLCRALGFEKHVVYEDGGKVAHAQLVLGNAMIMLSSATEEGVYDRWVKPPVSRDAATTQGIYVIVPDPDAHYARARKEGAVILMDLHDEDYGSREYTCRDLEGHVWTFGTYDPWAKDPA